MNTGPDGLPPLRHVIEKYGLAARKSLGQNFLLDLNLTGKIARMAGLGDATVIIEVGPGPGGLTRSLLANGAAKVIAIERDDRCLPALEDISTRYPGQLEIISADALEVDFEELVQRNCGDATDIQIVANLPYNIGTQLLINWLSSPDWPPFYSAMTLMFQREVAERIVAQTGGKSYGRLSVLANWLCETTILFDVPRQAFTPPPKVTSSIVRLVPRQQPLAVDSKALANVTRAAFGQRRKMLRQSLKALGGDALLSAAGVEGTRRAETLTVAEFAALANAQAGIGIP